MSNIYKIGDSVKDLSKKYHGKITEIIDEHTVIVLWMGMAFNTEKIIDLIKIEKVNNDFT